MQVTSNESSFLAELTAILAAAGIITFAAVFLPLWPRKAMKKTKLKLKQYRDEMEHLKMNIQQELDQLQNRVAAIQANLNDVQSDMRRLASGV